MHAIRLLAAATIVTAAACGSVSKNEPDADVGVDAQPDATGEVTLTVTRSGNGGGTVTSPAGLDCGATCSVTVPSGSTVTLTATPAADSHFMAWSGGGCSGTGPCELTVTADTSVDAVFALNHSVVVTLAGTGAGNVTSSPAGIDCGPGNACSQQYAPGTGVTLMATPLGDSRFVGWSGACTGVAACQVTVTAPVAVTATFDLNQHTLEVLLQGNGSGGVYSDPPGIDCGSDCSEAYASGTVVTLSPMAATGSVFAGWSGACTGTGACQVTMTEALSVRATFTLTQHTLTLSKSGTGTGTVTSNPAGITCGTGCASAAASFDYGTLVTLTATPAQGATFTGWSGACSGTGACSVSMTQARSVTASFSSCTGTTTLNYTGSMQLYTLPACTNTFVIEAHGAQGGHGSGGGTGGRGARMRGTFTITGGTQLRVLVGGAGVSAINGADQAGGTGGGGSFVAIASNNQLLLAAGGGGGAFSRTMDGGGPCLPCLIDGGPGQIVTAAQAGGGNGGTGGANGGGGGTWFWTGWHTGTGGGGYSGDGTDPSSGSGSYGTPNGPGRAFLNGGAGGAAGSQGRAGGFGGGGAAGFTAGGGGGYSGGGGGGWEDGQTYNGGGGGSFNGGANQNNSAGVRTGNGLVTISW